MLADAPVGNSQAAVPSAGFTATTFPSNPAMTFPSLPITAQDRVCAPASRVHRTSAVPGPLTALLPLRLLFWYPIGQVRATVDSVFPLSALLSPFSSFSPPQPIARAMTMTSASNSAIAISTFFPPDLNDMTAPFSRRLPTGLRYSPVLSDVRVDSTLTIYTNIPGRSENQM